MASVAEIIPADEFNPTPEDEAWAVATFNAEPAIPVNGQPVTLAEIVDHEGLAYRAWGAPVGDFLAEQLERVAQLVRWTGAATPNEHNGRIAIWKEEIRAQWFDRGYSEGVEAAKRALAPFRPE